MVWVILLIGFKKRILFKLTSLTTYSIRIIMLMTLALVIDQTSSLIWTWELVEDVLYSPFMQLAEPRVKIDPGFRSQVNDTGAVNFMLSASKMLFLYN